MALYEKVESLFDLRVSGSGAMITIKLGGQQMTVPYEAFMELRQNIENMIISEQTIRHFDATHFTAQTIGSRVFLYCPVGNICSWSPGDVEHRWCEWCKKDFNEIQGVTNG